MGIIRTVKVMYCQGLHKGSVEGICNQVLGWGKIPPHNGNGLHMCHCPRNGRGCKLANENAFNNYNKTKRHSFIDCLSPDVFERIRKETAEFTNRFIDDKKKKEESKCLIGRWKNRPKLKGSGHR